MSSFVYNPRASWIADCNLIQWMGKLGFKEAPTFFEKCALEPEWFWTNCIKDLPLEFSKPYSQLLEQGLPWPRWAVGGELSLVHHCIDRHLAERAHQPALLFESDDESHSATFTFQDLYEHSSWVAQQLVEAGAKPGDRAVLLMPMSLEMVSAFFGILRAGLSVIPIFSGYGVDAISSRIQDAQAKFVFVQEKTYRRGKEVPVSKSLEQITALCPSIQKVFSLSREFFLKKAASGQSFPPVSRPAESEALLLYTSGTTGKPKACVHTVFGVLATCGKEHRYAFDVRRGDRFFWYTDIGWMMGPWELIGALQLGASVVLYEGVPDYPDTSRLWRILEKHRVTHFGISPTAIRVLKKADTRYLEQQNFNDLRILGSTGEPWDEESWLWFFEKVGKKRCPIMNISGGTEIMGCLLGPSPLDPLKPASLAKPMLGVNAQIWSEDGERLSEGLGHLVCLSPLPSMTKGFLHKPELYLETYFQKFGDKVWYHGDWAYQDSDGAWFLKGRSDDTIKLAGKRVGPNEYESALMESPLIQEAAAVGIPHETKGECVYCYVVLKDPKSQSEDLRAKLMALITQKMGKALGAERLFFVTALPKTRSGKILRGLIRKIQLAENIDDSAVENLDSLEAVRKAL